MAYSWHTHGKKSPIRRGSLPYKLFIIVGEYLGGYLQLIKVAVACFSYDSAYVASMAEDSACRVWDIAKGESIAQLQREKVCLARMDIRADSISIIK